MSSILKVDTLQDVNGNAIISSDGSGNISISNLTTTGNINFGDNDKAQFGGSNDLQIWHDGGNAYVDNSGTGSLYVRGSSLLLTDATGQNRFLVGTDGGSTALFYNGTNAEKLATTSTGIDVTGTITSTGNITTSGTVESIAPERHSIRPSLNLDFANSKTLDPRITFTRASSGVYYDGYSSVKAEENLLQYSETFTDSDWQKASCSVIENQTAPNGEANEASTVTSTATTNTSIAKNNLIYSSGKKYTASFYFKYSDYQYLFIDFPNAHFDGNDNVIVDIQNGTITKAGDEGSSITSVGNGWYRVTLTATANSSGTSFLSFGTNLNSSSLSLGTDITGREFYVWGGQLEERDAVTAYTETTSYPITKYQPQLQSAGNNIARFDHNPTTGESLGLLIEEQRTNIALVSEQLGNITYFPRTRCTILSDNIVAPDGNLTADTILCNTNTTGGYYVQQTMTISASAQDIATSAYFKKGIGDIIALTVYDGANGAYQYYDLSDGTLVASTEFGTGFTKVDASIEDVGNGWYRCIFITNTAGNTTLNVQIRGGVDDYSSKNATAYVNFTHCWGIQVEQASFPTSYIKTTGSQATRSGEYAYILDIDQSEWFKQGEGSIHINASINGAGGTGFPRLYSISDGQAQNNCIQAPFNMSTSEIIFNQFVNGTQTAGFTHSVTVGDFFKNTLSYKTDDVNNSFNGGTVGSDTIAQIPIFDTFRLGADGFGSSNSKNVYIKKFTYYPIALTDNEIQDLSEA